MLRWCLSFVRKHTAVRRQLHRLYSTQNQTPRTKPAFKDNSQFSAYHLILICPATCFGLCYWQIKRKKWKTDIISTLDARLSEEPRPLPQDLSELEKLELYPIKVRGHFDYSNEVFIGPKSDNKIDSVERENGFYVITPFVVADRNYSILVNRGFYASKVLRNDAILKHGQLHGEREIIGYVRADQYVASIMNMLMDLNKPSEKYGHDIFHVRNIKLLAERCGTAEVFLDGDLECESDYCPRPVKPGIDLRDKHTEYAITWFTLGMITLLMYLRANAKARKEMLSVKNFVEKQASNTPK